MVVYALLAINTTHLVVNMVMSAILAIKHYTTLHFWYIYIKWYNTTSGDQHYTFANENGNVRTFGNQTLHLC